MNTATDNIDRVETRNVDMCLNAAEVLQSKVTPVWHEAAFIVTPKVESGKVWALVSMAHTGVDGKVCYVPIDQNLAFAKGVEFHNEHGVLLGNAGGYRGTKDAVLELLQGIPDTSVNPDQIIVR